jgi:hypothetical protein
MQVTGIPGFSEYFITGEYKSTHFPVPPPSQEIITDISRDRQESYQKDHTGISLRSTCMLFLLNQILYELTRQENHQFQKYWLLIPYDRAYDMSNKTKGGMTCKRSNLLFW